MVREIYGDLLKCGADFICHQTNFYGAMGGGVAFAIWHKLLNDSTKRAYVDLCAQHGRDLLGTVQCLPFAHEDGRLGLVFNLFCQDDNQQEDGGITDYNCMRKCLKEIEQHALRCGQTVAVPGNMGCGIAGGSWPTVRKIIDDVFGASPVQCTIVWLGRENR